MHIPSETFQPMYLVKSLITAIFYLYKWGDSMTEQVQDEEENEEKDTEKSDTCICAEGCERLGTKIGLEYRVGLLSYQLRSIFCPWFFVYIY